MRRMLSVVGLVGLSFAAMLSIASAASTTLQIERFVYDGSTPTTEGDEYVKICNVSAGSISLDGYKVGDEETKGSTEGMYSLPAISLDSGSCIIVAKRADQFNTRFGFNPDYEFAVGNDSAGVPNLTKYSTWGTGDWGLSNSGDEILLLASDDSLVDGICYEGGTNNFNNTGAGTIVTDACSNLNVSDGQGLRRTTATDTDTTSDFGTLLPTAITLRTLDARAAPVSPLAVALPALGLVAAGGVVAYRRRRA